MIPLPQRAYVPGLTARPEEGAYDAIRALAHPVTTSAAAAQNSAWTHGLRLARARFYWEAHEVLEPVWMNAPPNSAEREMTQAVIQLANGALKLEMARMGAAARLADLAEAHAREAARRAAGRVMGLSPAEVLLGCDALRRAAAAGERMAGLELNEQYNA